MTEDGSKATDDDAPETSGLRKGLTSYGDAGFSLFLRKAFIKGAGYTDAALDRPVIGIANTGSAYNPCHGNAAELIDAVKRGVMLAGGLPMDVPDGVAARELLAADQHVPAQPDVDRHRGDDPRAADGRGGADRRLRQDGARATDGRRVGRHSRDPARHRLDAHRLASIANASARAPTAGATGGAFVPGEIDDVEIIGRQRPARRERGHVLGDGHREHDGVCGRSARHDGAGRRVATRGDRRSHPHRRADRRAGGADRARQADDRQDPDRGRVPQRDACAARDRRLDERDRAPDRDRRTCRLRSRSEGARPHGSRDAGAARPEAFGPALHGGLPCRRRHGDVAARAEAAAQARCADGHRPHARRGDRACRPRLRAGRRAAAVEPDLSARRHRGAARQPRAGRRGDQAIGRRCGADGARRSRGGVRERRGPGAAHRRPASSMWCPPTSWC